MWPVQRPPAPPPAQQAVAPAPNQQALQAQQQALQGQVQPVLQPYYGIMVPQHVYGTAPAPAPAPQAPPGFTNPMTGTSWDQQSLASTFSTMSLHQPQQTDWYFDSSATLHMTSGPSTLSHILPLRYPFPSSIVVGDGSLLPVTATGAMSIPGHLS